MYQVTRAIVIFIATVSTAVAGTSVISSPPDIPDPNSQYLFYLHGKGIDEGSSSAQDPYRRTVQALSEQDFIVISEMRRSGVIRKFPDDHEKYASKIADEVKTLLAAGVPASNILVSGYSRGGTLTLMVSGMVDNPDVRFIVMAGCISEHGAYKKALPSIHERYSSRLKGRFLSLRDSGDEDFGSCESHFGRASGPLDYKEVVLSTGKGHLAFHEPAAEWIQPIVEWTRTK